MSDTNTAKAPAPSRKEALRNTSAVEIINRAFDASFRGGEAQDKARGIVANGVTQLIGEFSEGPADKRKCEPLLRLAQSEDKNTHTAVGKLLRERMGLELDKVQRDKLKFDGERQNKHRARTALLQTGYDLARAIALINMKNSATPIEWNNEAQTYVVPLATILPTVYGDKPVPGAAKAFAKGRSFPVRRAPYWLPLDGEGEAPVKVSVTYDTVLRSANKRGTSRTSNGTPKSDAKAMLDTLNKVTELTGAIPDTDDGTQEGSPMWKLCTYMVNHYRAGINAALARAERDKASDGDAKAKAAAASPAPRKVQSTATSPRNKG